MTEGKDKSLATFCYGIRKARRNPESRKGRKLTADRIASLDALGFDWEPQASVFQDKVDELKAYKAKHGHLNVKAGEDKSLAAFCMSIRRARRYPEKPALMKLTADRIASLDALGFDWEPRRERRESFPPLPTGPNRPLTSGLLKRRERDKADHHYDPV